MAFACCERLKTIELCWLTDANVQCGSNKLPSLSPCFVSTAWFDRMHENVHADKIENIELYFGLGHQNRLSAITTHNVVVIIFLLALLYSY